MADRDQAMLHILVIHERSVPFVGGTIAFLDAVMRDRYPRYAQIRVANSVDEAQVEGPAVIFMIGERLGTFTKRPDCFYVHMNFSVVAMIGSPFAMSLKGAQHIWKKRALLESKVRVSDAVLDFYPAQTNTLSRRLSCPVLGFMPYSETSEVPALPLADRPWDVCFVGSLSPRRERVLEEVCARGLTLSPASGADIESIAAQSRTTLNVHFHASNHLEIPRIIGSLSAATPVVTERSYGLKDILDGGIISCRARRLASLTEALVANPARLNELSEAARSAHWRYKNRAHDLLHTSLDEIDRLSRVAKMAF